MILVTLEALKKQKLSLRKTNPTVATVAEMVIDGATKLAKAEQREVTVDDLEKIISKSIKQTSDTIALIESKEGNASRYKEELNVLLSYVPVPLSWEDSIKLASAHIASLPAGELNKKNFGKILSSIKALGNVDTKAVSKLLTERLG